MKKILALVLAGVFALSLAACTSSTTDNNTSTETSTVDTAKGEGVMTYAEYIAAELDAPVVVETYVQAKQTWWDNKATVYTQDADGAYFAYNMACTEEEYDTLVEGQKIKITGYKTEWAGEVEIADGTFELEDGNWIAPIVDVTEYIGTDTLATYQNQKVKFSGMEIVAVSYKNNEPGDDIYVTAAKNGTNVEFCVEAYLSTTQPGSSVYESVGNLSVGEVVDIEGFLYWYEGADTHITSVIFG